MFKIKIKGIYIGRFTIIIVPRGKLKRQQTSKISQQNQYTNEMEYIKVERGRFLLIKNRKNYAKILTEGAQIYN